MAATAKQKPGAGWNDWSFREDLNRYKEISKKKSAKSRNKSRAAKKRRKLRDQATENFYESDEWRTLRYRVIRKYGARCMACGRSPRKHGIVVHVDHIKPRSKHPKLELVFENLQILCEDCNLGKSNIDDTDWRPKGG